MTVSVKTCSRCRSSLSITRFYRRLASPDGLQPICKSCESESRAQRSRRFGAQGFSEPEFIICTSCGLTKTASEFPRRRRCSTGRSVCCSDCTNDMQRLAYSARKPEGWVNSNLVGCDDHGIVQCAPCRRTYIASWVRASYAKNPTPRREASRRWRERNPHWFSEYQSANADRIRERGTRWKSANPDKVRDSVRMRRVRKAGVTKTIRFDSDICSVPTCQTLLVPGVKFPHPMSTTIGHEPPLSRLSELGVTTVTERPEHWICNQHKSARLDSELLAASRSSLQLQP